jgi:serine/threonine protein kinase
MNRFCEKCARITLDGNLWCQERDCPAERGHALLEYGDFVGDLKVTKLLRVWRTAALYEATRGEEKVLLKVAHETEDSEERLKREALAFEALTEKPWGPVAFIRSFMSTPRRVLPEIISPYPVPSKRPYGELTLRGETKFFSVFRHVEGKFLADLLLENPQMWHYQAAWLIITLAEAMQPLAAAGKTNLCLTPDVILVDTDEQGNLRPVLMDLGFIVAGNEIESVYELARLTDPAYTAPELQGGRGAKTVTPAADVYSLGMLFYEMLAGKPAFENKMRRDEKIREAVGQFRGSLPVGRPELEAAGVIALVDKATAPSGRYNSVAEFGSVLAGVYGRPPVEKRPVPTRTYVLLSMVGLVFLIVTGIAAYYLIGALAAR